MKVNVLLFLLVFSFLGTAQASIDGNWIGWAYWKYQGEGPKCHAQIQFRESETTFALTKGDLDCDIVVMEIPERVFTKENGELLMDGKSAGKYLKNLYTWEERYNERTMINVTIKVDGTNLTYTEIWVQDENTLLYEINGRLFKK